MVDVDKAIATAVKTGKVSFGAKSAVSNAKAGKTKLIVTASNCPREVRGDLEYFCKLSNVPLVSYGKSSIELAAVCGKPFLVSALSIRELGEAELIRLTGNVTQERTSEESE